MAAVPNRGFVAELRQRLGVPPEAQLDLPELLAALDEVLAESYAAAAAQQPAAVVPAGMVRVSETELAALKADAAAGEVFARQQEDRQRRRLVTAAVADNRITPAEAVTWEASLRVDPGSAELLASLRPGALPLAAVGYTGGIDEAPDDDRIYANAWGTEDVNR